MTGDLLPLSLLLVERLRAGRIRRMLQNSVSICGQVEKDSFRYLCALIGCYPFVVQVRTTVALRILERAVDGAFFNFDR